MILWFVDSLIRKKLLSVLRSQITWIGSWKCTSWVHNWSQRLQWISPSQESLGLQFTKDFNKGQTKWLTVNSHKPEIQIRTILHISGTTVRSLKRITKAETQLTHQSRTDLKRMADHTCVPSIKSPTKIPFGEHIIFSSFSFRTDNTIMATSHSLQVNRIPDIIGN